MRVSIDYEGKVKGMNKVLDALMEGYWEDLDFEQAEEACRQFGRLVMELAELAWVCKRNAEAGRFFGYQLEVFVTKRGLAWQRYRVEAVPPPASAAHSIAKWRGLANYLMLPLHNPLFLWRTGTALPHG